MSKSNKQHSKGKSSSKGGDRHHKSSSSSYPRSRNRFTERNFNQPQEIENEFDESGEVGEDGDVNYEDLINLTVNVCLWEFGQNDPNRDSGSKLVRLGYVSRLKVGQTFGGIVLSSEATTVLSPADREIIETHGIAGINCSWNRLEEIPFNTMGKSRNQRCLPLIVAANTVNYGKAFKMNTAEALAASLYIAGFKLDAEAILLPFSYGEEFIRLNYEALESYSQCSTEAEVRATMMNYIQQNQKEKEAKKAKKLQKAINNNAVCYAEDPLMSINDEENNEEENNEEEFEIEELPILKANEEAIPEDQLADKSDLSVEKDFEELQLS